MFVSGVIATALLISTMVILLMIGLALTLVDHQREAARFNS